MQKQDKGKPPVKFARPETRRVGLLMSDEDQEALSKEWAEEDVSKLLLLAAHFGMPAGPNTFTDLALELAREHYSERQATKQKWTEYVKAVLVVEMERKLEAGGDNKSHEWAARQLAKQPRWANFLRSNESLNTTPDPGESLRKKYYAARNSPMAKIMRSAYQYDEHMGTIDEWEYSVDSIVKNNSL